MPEPLAPRSILVIRRDNIGDLLLTTPLIRALRTRFPQAWIGALVNSYNAPVVLGNPDLDAVYAYRKLKHREPGQSRTALVRARLHQWLELRQRHIDCAILATPEPAERLLRQARWLGAKHVVSSRDLPPRRDVDSMPEAQRVFRLAELFGIAGAPPPARLVPDADELATVASQLQPLRSPAHRLMALHLSARKPSQRWPLERFAELARRAARHHGTASVLLWAPGSEHNPVHPGDDEKAARLAAMLVDVPHVALPTQNLPRLIAALANVDLVCCGDGGAMHLAAALGRPLVCWFGASHVARWRPWGTRYRLLQPASRDVRDVSVEQAWQALLEITHDMETDVPAHDYQAQEPQP